MDRTKVASNKNLVRFLAIGGIGFALLGGLSYYLLRKSKNTPKTTKISREVTIKILKEVKKGLFPLLKEICQIQTDYEAAGRPIPEDVLRDLSKSESSDLG